MRTLSKQLIKSCNDSIRYQPVRYKTKKVEKVATSEALSTVKQSRSHSYKLGRFFKQNESIGALKPCIPDKYLNLKRKTSPDHLYLIDPVYASKIADYVYPVVENAENRVVCETNPGLGLISLELLKRGLKLVRLYEPCPEFRSALKDFDNVYKSRVELFTKDIFLLHRYAFMDKNDRGNRVEQMLRNVPKKSWDDDPSMTIIGTMSKPHFIKHLINVFTLQTDIGTYGRIQLFAIMRPKDFVIFTASSKDNLHTYKTWSVFFNLFFDYKLLEKIPREYFLPWEAEPKSLERLQYPSKIDRNYMYLVQIDFKRELPTTMDNLLPLCYFIKQLFGRGTKNIIPTIEKWMPGCGQNIIVPNMTHEHYFKDLGIFTSFGELSPLELLGVFREMVNYPAYKESPFMAMVEANLIKNETIETGCNDTIGDVEKNIIDDIEIKLTD